MTEQPDELLARLRRHATDAPDRPAIVDVASRRPMTYRQLREAADALGAELMLTLPSRSVLMLRTANRPEYHVAFFAALAARMTVFPVSPEIAQRELNALAERSGAVALIDGNLAVKPLAVPPGDRKLDAGLLLQSSGTTGLPKVAHRDTDSLNAVSAQMARAIGMEPADRVLACVPLCHSYGLEHGLLAPIFAGATVHLMHGFDLAGVRRELLDASITTFPAVPSIYEMLANFPEGVRRFPSLRTAYSAGGPLPASVYENVHARFGLRVGQLYGATEIGSVTYSHAGDAQFEHASVGRAMDGVALRVDDNGQLLVRARSMMSAYVGDASPMTDEGFFPTGDLARLDAHGNLFITGRLKLLIDVGGLKVNPLEVEQAICEHPAVAACVVVPIRLSETVFRLKAVVTPADTKRPPSADELRLFTRERLTAHKIPRVFELRDSLPRSATGKVLRHLLAESA